jgi:hypothetical protein
VQALKELAAHPGHSVHEEAIGRLAEIYARAIVFNNLDEVETARLRGYVKGLQDAANFDVDVVTKTEEYLEYVERSGERAKPNSTDALLWGSPYVWGGQHVGRK